MGNKGNDATLRKRQQIDSSKRTMFIAVAVVAFVSGVALVVSFFLIQQIILHSKVINEKQKTVSTIQENIVAVEELKDNVRVLDTNEALMSARASDDSSALQVVLDALPTEANADALGASLQLRLIGATSGIALESMTIDNSSDVEVSEDGVAGIGFMMSVEGSAQQMKEFLVRLERSIRVIQIDSLTLDAANDGLLTANIVGQAYYQPARVVELGEKVVKP